MKRNMELIREMMLEVESKEFPLSPEPFKLEMYTENEIDYHFRLLKEAGLMNGIFMDALPHATSLTWEGHNFIENAKNSTVWGKTKDFIKEKGGSASFQVWVEVLKNYALKYYSVE